MVSKNDQPLPDIAWQLDQIGETTTAADLVRKKGQSRKLKVLSEKTLVGWIEGMLGQYIAGKEDSFSDREKEALLEKMQADLAAKIEAQGRLEKERAAAQAKLDQLMTTLDNTELSKTELDDAIKALRAQLVQKESHERELQESNDEMQDELERSRALIAATIKEKDKLHVELQGVKERDATFRSHAVKSADLCGGILAIDRDYYGERHQTEHPVPPEATQEAAFFHDFDVAAAVIETLSKDLERLRQILHDQETGRKTKPDEQGAKLLESDLQLLEQLKSGSLAATDVAQPVAALVEAIEGARAEAEALEDTAADQLGIAGSKKTVFTSVPEQADKPAEILAGATRVVRELAAALAKERLRLGAVKSMADEADEARNERESELDRIREANTALMEAISVQAKAQGIKMPAAVTQADGDLAERETAAVEVVRQLAGKDLKAEADVARMKTELEQARAEGAALRRQVDDQLAQLKSKRDAEGRLAAGLKDLGQVVFAEAKPSSQAAPATASISAGASRVQELDKALAKPGSDQGDVLGAAYAVVDALKRDVAKRDEKNKALANDIDSQRRGNDDLRKRLTELEHAHDELKQRSAMLAKTEKAIAERFIEAAHADPELADAAADLAVALESKDEGAAQERSERAAATIELLAHRKQALAKQVDALTRDLTTIRTDGDKRTKAAEQDLAQARSRLTDLDKQANAAREQRTQLEARVSELEQERDEAMASGKEVIQQLNQSRERSVNELTDLRARESAAQLRLTELQRRVQDAEAANRALVEALSELHRLGGESSERAALDEAMTELPGDEDVPLKPEAAQKVADAGKRLIADLADRSARLKGATERLSRTDARVTELDRLLNDERAALAELRDHVREVEHERDEMAASGKEVIAKVTQARDARITELAETRAHADKLQRTLAAVQTRTAAAESANRALAESLSRIAAAESGSRDVEDRRVELETCLSELPEDGEVDVVVAADLPVRLAEAGQRVVEAIVVRARSYKEVAAKAQAQAQEVQAKAERLDKDLAAVRGESVAAKGQVAERQQQLDNARTELAQLGRRTDDAEAAARDLSLALQKVAGPESSKAAGAIAQALEAHASGKPIPHHTLAKAGGEVAEALARTRDDGKRLATELERLRAEQATTQKDAADTKRKVAELEKQLTDARNDEKRLADSASALTKELLATAKAAVADVDQPKSERIAKTATELDQQTPAKRIAAGVEVLVTLRDRLNAQRIDLANARTKAETESQRHADELERLRGQLAGQVTALSRSEKDLSATATERDKLANKLDGLKSEHDRIAAGLKTTQDELRLTKADLEGYQAGEGSASSAASVEVQRLRKDLAAEKTAHDQAEHEIAHLTENTEALQARLVKQSAELRAKIDQLSKDLDGKQKALDGVTGHKIDVEALQAELEGMRGELSKANVRLKDYEAIHGQHAGSASKSTGLAKQLAEAQQHRDGLRDENLKLEGQLADIKGQLEEVRVGREKQAKDTQSRLDKKTKEAESIAKELESLSAEHQKLKNEMAHAKAKMRKLTEG